MTALVSPPPDRPAGVPPPSALKLLAGLRRRIRWYVAAEGCALLVGWLGLAFWIALSIDYLPVLVGADEMPVTARAWALGLTLVVGLTIVYRSVLRRVFHPLPDPSLALLVERRFPVFADSLVTAVELADGEGRRRSWELAQAAGLDVGEVDPERDMLVRTMDLAAAHVADVRLRRIFRFRPLAAKLGGAVVALASLLLLGLISRETLSLGVARLLWMSPDTWPRRARIEMVGFADGLQTIAKGTDLDVRVKADASRDYPPPETCTILYTTAVGDRGRVNMSRDGEPRDGYQYYMFNGKPFKSILDDIRFDVVGSDHRLRDQRVRVVLSPVVEAAQLRSELPAYTGLLPREETWSPGVELPLGSRVTVRVRSSKPLRSATVKDIDMGQDSPLEFSFDGVDESRQSSEFSYEIPVLRGRHAVSISLTDTDGISSAEPYLLTIGAVADAIPRVDVSLRGIGNAITPVARLPIAGSVRDDYGIARSWFQLEKGQDVREFDLQVESDEPFADALDLRQQAASGQPNPLQLAPEDRVVFSVRAADRYDLDDQPRIGASDPISLSVVRPDELLAILDGRELGLRRRFEQIRSELVESRDSLLRLRASLRETAKPADASTSDASTSDEAAAPDESISDEAAAPDKAAARGNQAELRLRWVQWASQKADQSTREVAGLAGAFEDIRDELVNNRVDTPQRQTRLEQEIIAPLRRISDEMFPEFTGTLAKLQAILDDPESAVEPSQRVVEQADSILLAMDEVLNKMLELEDYAELVDIVRSIIEQQEKILKQTQEEQKRRVLDLLR